MSSDSFVFAIANEQQRRDWFVSVLSLDAHTQTLSYSDLLRQIATTVDRTLLHKNLVSETSARLNAGKSPSYAQSDQYIKDFYYKVLTADNDLLGTVLYWTVRQERV